MCRATSPAWWRLGSSVWPVPFAKPGAVCCHLRALRRGRMPLASRSLVALFRRTPPQLDAVVRVVAHFEIPYAVEHVLERERPRRTVAARIRKLAIYEVRCEHAPQLGLYVRYGLPIRYRVTRSSTFDAIRKSANYIDRDQQTEIARRSGKIFPCASRLEYRWAVGHFRLATGAVLIFSSILDCDNAGLHLFFECRNRRLHGPQRIERLGRHHVVHFIVELLDREARLL